jgi:aminoglycoside 6-adenylyltransferase
VEEIAGMDAAGAQRAYDELIARVVTWAEAQSGIRVVLVVGSRARAEHPADAWSDLDLVIFATDPRAYLDDSSCFARFGDVWLTFLEQTAVGGGVERRVLYRGGLDVDFALFPASQLDLLLAGAATAVLARGARVALDKDGQARRLIAAAPPATREVAAPTQEAFEQDVQDFWYHAVWIAKKLRRGEVWTAAKCCDGLLQARLLHMIEWHARALRGPAHDTWHEGRFVEEWADPRALAELRGTMTHYDADDTWRALAAAMHLYHWLAHEVAANLGYSSPDTAAGHPSAFVQLLAAER